MMNGMGIEMVKSFIAVFLIWVPSPQEWLLLLYNQENFQDWISPLGHGGPDAPG